MKDEVAAPGARGGRRRAPLAPAQVSFGCPGRRQKRWSRRGWHSGQAEGRVKKAGMLERGGQHLGCPYCFNSLPGQLTGLAQQVLTRDQQGFQP